MAPSIEQQMLVEQRVTNEKKSTGVAYLLWLFFGSLGGHRFYLGKTGSAVIMLIIFAIGIITAGIGVGLVFLLAVGIWALVDAFLIPGIISEQTSAARTRIANEVEVLSRR